MTDKTPAKTSDREARASRTDRESRKINDVATKLASDKTARLKAARLARDDADDGKSGSKEMPPAGPHAKPELTNPDATPGAGALPDTDRSGDVDGGAG